MSQSHGPSYGLSRRAHSRVRRALMEQLEARHLLASDYLLLLDGIKGESTDSRHPGAIEIQSFSWGASNAGRVANPLTTEEFRFVTNTSTASPLLYQAAAEGKHFTKAVLFGRKSGETQQEYLKVELKEVFISSFQSRSLNEELPKDEIAISFSSITQQVTSPASDGTAGETTTASWTVPRNTQKVESDELLSKQPSSNVDQTDAFLFIDGIKGELSDEVFKDAIPVESFSWGVSQSSSRTGGSGRATFQDLHFVREIGKASPILARAAAEGKHFPDATLVVRRDSATGTPNNFIKITLSDVVVSSYSTAAQTGTSPMEEIQLSFASMTQAVSAQAADRGTVNSKFIARGAATAAGESLIDDTVPVQRGVDFLLEIDGVKGESAVADHKGAIELDSFSWGVSQSRSNGGGGAGKVSLQDFHFTSTSSSASPVLLSSVASGTQATKAVLFVRKAGERPQDYIKIQLDDLLVSSYQVQSTNNQLPQDSVSLNFTKITYSYERPGSADGQVLVPIKSEWTAPPSAERVANTVVPYDFHASPNESSTAASYIKFEGVDGESVDSRHKGEIEVLSWSWGVSQTRTTSTGGGASVGKVSFQDFHFVVANSKASPKLYEKIFADPVASEQAVLSVRRSGAQNDYIKFGLTRPDLRSVQVQSIDRSQPIEEFSAGYIKLEMRHLSPGTVAGIVVGSASVRSRDGWEDGDDLLRQTNALPSNSDFFLEIEGIKGESTDATSPGTIDVQSFSWGVSQPSFSTRGGGGSGKASVQDFSFVMDSSSVSPQLLRSIPMGKHFPNAVLVSRASDQTRDNYLKIKLTDVLVSSYQTQGKAGSAPQDEIALNAIKIELGVASPGTAPVSTSLNFSRPGQVEFVKGDSLLSITSPSSRASDYFLKIEGIKGESASKDHKGWIEVDSFSWGVTAQISNTRKIDGIKFEGLSFGTQTDSSSPQLLSSFASGKHIPNLKFQIATPSGQTYLKYELSDVVISSFGLSGGDADETDFSASFGSLSLSASPPIAALQRAGGLSTEAADIFYTDQDEFVLTKKRR